MASNNVVLITGANRGIGKDVTAAFLQRPSTTVIAAVRNVQAETSRSLALLPKDSSSKLIVIKIDSASDTDAQDAVVTLQKTHGIEYIDIVISNAGIMNDGKTVMQTTPTSIEEHFRVNTIGPLVLLQATAPLLKASKADTPKFVAISSFIGTIAGLEMIQALPPVLSPYGASKAALNWFLRQAHFEEEWLTTIALHPGLVMTDMSKDGFGAVGVDPAKLGAITVEQSVAGIMERTLNSTKEHSGTFQSYDGKVLPW